MSTTYHAILVCEIISYIIVHSLGFQLIMTSWCSRSSRKDRMLKVLFLSIGIASMALGAIAQTTLYDHGVADPTAKFVNQKFGDRPTLSTGIVDDVSFGTSVVIQDILIWTDRSSTAWLTGLHQALVNVYPKIGSNPPNADADPIAGGVSHVVVREVVNNGLDSYLIMATFKIVLQRGNY